MFISYFFSFMLSYFGFLLGKSTKEEHKEIKRTVLVLIDLLRFVFYIGLFYLLFRTSVSYLFFVLLVLFLVSKYFKNKDILRLHDIVLFGTSFLALLKSGYVYWVLVLLFALIFENSFKKFHKKEEIYSILIYAGIYLGYILFL